MKKINILLFSLVCCFILAACGNEKKEEGLNVRIYYLDNKETTLMHENHILEGETTKEQIVEILTLLGTTPENKEMKPSISGGINIVNFAYEDNIVTVSIGSKYSELSKTTSILTRAAIVKSLTQLDEVDGVNLTIEGEPLTDSDGILVGTMTGDMFLDDDDEELGDYEKIVIRLYFTNEDGDTLVPIDRSLVHNLDMSNMSMEKFVIEQLLQGPANDSSYPTINPDTKLLSVTVKDGICYVNFDSGILTPVNNVTSDVVIYSVVNSLTELNEVSKVQISIDGKKDTKFRDSYGLTTLFEKNEDLIK